MHGVFFGIETALSPNEWDKESDIDIHCAVAVSTADVMGSDAESLKYWYAGMGDETLTFREAVVKLGTGAIKAEQAMSREEVEGMVDQLIEFVKQHPVSGESGFLFTWAGMSFTFPAIVHNVGTLHAVRVNNLALDSIDPCFQFIRGFGFPLSLTSVAKAMLGEDEIDPDISNYVLSWRIQPAAILSRCYSRVKLLSRVVQAISDTKSVSWENRNGHVRSRPMNGWFRVKKVMRWDEPDRSWMNDYDGRWDVSNMTGWMKL